MNKKILLIGCILVAVVVIGSTLPMQTFFGLNTTTINYEHGGFSGSGELLGPNARSGYIMSYMHQGLSETIVVSGKINIGTWAAGSINSYHYVVYGKQTPWGSWEVLSKPGSTSTYISTQNPGRKSIDGLQFGGSYNADSYSFELVGNTYRAIRVDFICNSKNVFLNPLEPWTEKIFQRDEAYMYEGWGGLYLPKDSSGTPRSTFEIGEHVNIGVETTYGGYSVGEGGETWRVVMNYPEDRGGGIFKEQNYGDNTISQFTFSVSADMFSTSSNNLYQIRIFNTLLPQGTLNVNTIDFIAKAPSDVLFSNAPHTVNSGNPVSVTLSATVNEQTQLSIESFEISVYYGSYQSLLPTNPNDPRWIIPTTHVSAINNQYVLSFTPVESSYVTILAKAYDGQGRSSNQTRYWSLYCYSGATPPEDVIDTGDGFYGGGYFDPWLPWQPGGTWEIDQSTINILISVIVFLGVVIFVVLSPFPQNVKILLLVLGFVLAFIIWFYLNGGI
jgi:hypothetical protein